MGDGAMADGLRSSFPPPSGAPPAGASERRHPGLTSNEELHRYYGRRLAERHRRRRPHDRSLLAQLADWLVRLRLLLAPPGSWLDTGLGWLRRSVGLGTRTTGPSIDLDYEIFLARSGPSKRELGRQARRTPSAPTLHLVECLPSGGGALRHATADALLRQSYPHWTWSVGAERRDPDPVWRRADPRFRMAQPFEALAADGTRGQDEFVGLLHRGQAPTRDALFHFALAASVADPPDLIYADVDWLDGAGVRHDPWFKPDWSRAAMLSADLLSGLLLVRRQLLQEALMSARPGSMWDLHLLLAERASRVVHLPRLLTHLPGEAHDAWPVVDSQACDVVGEHLGRRGLPGAHAGVGLGGWVRATWRPPHDRAISIVIPSRDQPEILERCLWSLAERTRPGPTEVVVVDTGSGDPRTEAVYRAHPLGERLRVVRQTGDFNFAAACNAGARAASGDLILFLNNDTEALEPDWIERMAQWFVFPDVGIVGAKLLYPDETIQHAGVVVGMGGLASHLFQGEPELSVGLFGSDQWYRDLSAVTAACMLVSRRVFEALNGFDEAFRLNYQDVDLCLRARRGGWRVIYTPDARLLHHEGLSHRKRIPRADFELASQRWLADGHLDGDPFFNPNLSYMSAMPTFNRGRHDHPRALNQRLMRRLPRKEILTLPDDLR